MQTNISFSKSRERLANSICLSRNSPLQRSQRDEGGGSTRVRMGFPFARHASARLFTNFTMKFTVIMERIMIQFESSPKSTGRPRLRCDQCGHVGGDARPNWNELHNP